MSRSLWRHSELRRAYLKAVRAGMQAETVRTNGSISRRAVSEGNEWKTFCRSPLAAALATATTVCAAISHAEALDDTAPLISPHGPSCFTELYTVHDETIGRGQFGIVRRATNKATGEVVAVKSVRRKKGYDHDFFQEIESHREAAKHPNVVGIQGVYGDEQNWYVVMDLAEEGELYDKLTTEDDLQEWEVRCLLREVVDAVAHIHERGIVHFDIKPENILLTSAADRDADIQGRDRQSTRLGKGLLADFGSSFRLQDGSIRARATKEYTAAYSAPEVVSDGKVDKKADVWSLGVIAYVMVKGHHPFDPTSEADEDEIIANVVSSEPDWDGINPIAVGVLRRMLNRNPAERPSAREILQSSWLNDHNHFD